MFDADALLDNADCILRTKIVNPQCYDRQELKLLPSGRSWYDRQEVKHCVLQEEAGTEFIFQENSVEVLLNQLKQKNYHNRILVAHNGG